MALLDDHHAAAAYGCPNCGVHHGCFEMVERNQQLEAEVARLRPRRRGRLVTAILRAGQTVTTEVPADRQWRNPLDPRLPPRSRP